MDTKTVSVSELSGAALDWAVAKCEGATSLWHDTIASWWFTLDGRERTTNPGWSQAQRFRPSRDWVHGGPIIEREDIAIRREDSGQWAAHIKTDTFNGFRYGPAPLIAAMRCYVASKMGNTISIPEKLLSHHD